jgi:hypothetical protein
MTEATLFNPLPGTTGTTIGSAATTATPPTAVSATTVLITKAGIRAR